ncbi:sigma-70 family RNA polymerase sigma factor [Streptomyces sp. NPDC017056]|uniref:sigma-70 family RNA polymerase sigma factor n=1 Tax=Streptomyces sp. NPDC017056 TaxID=3364973 RepID=UPI003799C808
MRNAPEVRGPTDPHDLPNRQHSLIPAARTAPESEPSRRRLTKEQVAELGRLAPFLEGLVLQAGMGYAMEDLVQTCVYQLVRAWSRDDFVMDRQDGGRAFARKVMRDVIADAARSNDRDLLSLVGEVPEISVEPDEGAHIRDDCLASIERFLAAKLPETLYPVARLAIVEGLKQGEIARSLGIDRHTVARRYKRVREELEPYKDTIHDEVLGDVTS